MITLLHTKHWNPIYYKPGFGQAVFYMESKERNVEARTTVWLIDVNDYFSTDDQQFLLFCSLASSQNERLLSCFCLFFCWLFKWCSLHLQQISRKGFVKHCQTALSSQGRFTCVIVLRNTLSDKQEMAVLQALICLILQGH